MPKLKIALIDDNQERAQYIRNSLIEHDFDVVACLIIDHINISRLEQLSADVILLDMDHPQRDIIESCVSQFNLPLFYLLKIAIKTPLKVP
jgi:response regulator NasT